MAAAAGSGEPAADAARGTDAATAAMIADEASGRTSEAAGAAAGETPGALRQPKVASSAPFRVHVLRPRIGDGDDAAAAAAAGAGAEAAACDCGRQHMVFGQSYRYCTCGLSKTQPFCDGSERAAGSPFEPLSFVCDQQQTFYLLCGCKRTKKPPFCDGSHIHITWRDLEW